MWPYRHYFDDPRKRRSAKPQFRGVQREKAPKTNARRSPRTVVFLQNCPKSLQARKRGKTRPHGAATIGELIRLEQARQSPSTRSRNPPTPRNRTFAFTAGGPPHALSTYGKPA